MQKIRVEIEFKRVRQTEKGKFIHAMFWPYDKPGLYTIRVDPRGSILNQSCALVHELVHMVFDIFFKRIDEKKEHVVCNGTERKFKALMTKYWRQ